MLFLILKSVLLGIVEGVTEFLPVSSTGHLVIAENLIGFRGQSPNYVEMYTYVIQLGAILAVVVLYWAKIKETLVHFFPRPGAYDRSGFNFWFTIFVACIPGGMLGFSLTIWPNNTCLRRFRWPWPYLAVGF